MPWLDAAVREEPDALRPVLVRASALLALRRYADALAEAERGLRTYPQDSTLRGIARKARGTLERRAQLSPCEVAFARALELLAAGRPDEASRQVELARQELPPDPALVLRFAERLIEAHQPQAARGFLTRHDPALTQASAAGKLEWARTALHLEGLGESLRWVDLALAQEPSLERARDWRLSLMIVLSRRSQADLAKDPDDTPAQRNLEKARSALEGYLSQLDETLAEVPGDSVHRQARVEVLIELGRREEALADCERGIELDPAYPPLRRLRQQLISAAE